MTQTISTNIQNPYLLEPVFNFDSLRALITRSTPNQLINLVCGELLNDGYGGLFSYDFNSILPDDNTDIIAPMTNIGRWIRVENLSGSGGGGSPFGPAGGDLSSNYPNPTVVNLHIAGQTQGSIVYYNGTKWVILGPGTEGYYLTTHSSGQNPTWTAPSTAVGGDLSGSLPNPTVVNLHLSGQTTGSIAYFNGGHWVVLGADSDGKVLTTHGLAAPTWETPSTALPVPTQIGQILYSVDSDTLAFTVELPVVNDDDGFIITNDDGYIVVV